MEEHPDFGIGLLREEYNGAFIQPVLEHSCNELRSDKWLTCHPENGALSVCDSAMTISQIMDLYQSHKKCYEFRVLENQSFCFSKKDQGHIQAEQIEKKHVEQCRLILESKMDLKPATQLPQSKTVTKLPQKNPHVPIFIPIDSSNEPIDSSNEPIDSSSSGNVSKPVTINIWVWIILGVIGMLFLYYVY